jgi:hypothetical protein
LWLCLCAIIQTLPELVGKLLRAYLPLCCCCLANNPDFTVYNFDFLKKKIFSLFISHQLLFNNFFFLFFISHQTLFYYHSNKILTKKQKILLFHTKNLQHFSTLYHIKSQQSPTKIKILCQTDEMMAKIVETICQSWVMSSRWRVRATINKSLSKIKWDKSKEIAK